MRQPPLSVKGQCYQPVPPLSWGLQLPAVVPRRPSPHLYFVGPQLTNSLKGNACNRVSRRCGARTTHSSSGYKAPWKARTRHFSLMAEGGLCLPSRVPRACMESRFESWAAQNYHNAHTQPTPGQVPSPSRASVRLSGDGQWIGPAAVWPERGLGSVVLLPPAAPLQPLSPLRAFPPLSASLPPRPLPFLSGCGSVSVSGHVFSPSLCVCLTQFLPFFFF